MNDQFLMNKAIAVQYAFKKDAKGERHSISAERLLASLYKLCPEPWVLPPVPSY
jgi:hypothetical protein